MKKVLFLLLITTFTLACSHEKERVFSFYHWKTNANLSKVQQDALGITSSERIYLRYFDVTVVNETEKGNGDVFPVAVLNKVDDRLKELDIIPVVFITNRVLKQNYGINAIAKRIIKLIREINQAHFKNAPETIQIDCDWTQSTKDKYFELLTILKQSFEVSTTIRLHQIKFKERTGVPPVNQGTLMLYNVGDLKDENQNSILEAEIVRQYISANTQYPIKLNVALPIFSQTVVKNNDGNIRLINHTDQRGLDEREGIFKRLDKGLYEVKADTLYKGLYLFKGYKLKLENVPAREVIDAYKHVKKCSFVNNEIIFYHLEDGNIANPEFDSLFNQL